MSDLCASCGGGGGDVCYNFWIFVCFTLGWVGVVVG